MSHQGPITNEILELVVPINTIDDGDSPYVVSGVDYYISCDVTGGTITIKLPDSPNSGHVFIVKDSLGNSSTNHITVTTVSGTVLIDGATSQVISFDFRSLSFIFNSDHYEVF